MSEQTALKIRAFVSHKPTCAADGFDTGLCDCGLRAALKELERMKQLARQEAFEAHCDSLRYSANEGHAGDMLNPGASFEDCPHADCRLVRP